MLMSYWGSDVWSSDLPADGAGFMIATIALILFLLVLSAFFSGSETALTAASRYPRPLTKEIDMSRKIALVTGGNRGIGLETSRQLAAQGVHVIVAARELSKATETVAELKGSGGSAEAVQLDVTNAASIARAVDDVNNRHGRLAIPLTNAGVIRSSPDGVPSSQPVDDWRWIFETNVFGLVETTQPFLPLLKKADAARIVNLSSILGSIELHEQRGSTIHEMKIVPAYSASKRAVHAYNAHLARSAEH